MCGYSSTEKQATFPEELLEQGLSEDVITLTLSEVQAGDTSYSWQLNAIPSIGFYRALHACTLTLRSNRELVKC